MQSMLTPIQLMALILALSQLGMAGVYAIVCRALRVRWAALLAVGFFINAIFFGNVAFGNYVVGGSMGARPLPLNACLVLAALATITIGLVDYVGTSRPLAQWLDCLSIGVAAAAAAGVLTNVVTRAVMLPVLVGYVVGWAMLFAFAMFRHPREGNGLLVIVLLAYPINIGAMLMGYIHPDMFTVSIGVPYIFLGMALLTTGLLRAHRRAAAELAARERAQAALEAANESLEHRVRLRTVELQETIEGLESFNRSISHDLRGPLGGIAGVARMARLHIHRGDAASAERLLDGIATQAATSGKLIDALMTLARTSDASLQIQPVDTNVVVRDAIAACTQSRPALVSVTDVAVAQLPTVEADLELSRQVFVNLIGNALKFASFGQQPTIEVGVVTGDEAPVFFVRDNGVGFDASKAKQMFKPFARMHGDRFEGFGVGLSIVKRIIDRHGGRLWAQSEPGHGATFFFSFGKEVERTAALQQMPAYCPLGDSAGRAVLRGAVL